ncbi:MAG: galactokinase family protein, partial [Actinobacteria bacterium]|nr:galactokinase family protein [Actinomycetota bacterium]
MEITELFSKGFGYLPAVVASAPGRVNLIGEHVDYSGG